MGPAESMGCLVVLPGLSGYPDRYLMFRRLAACGLSVRIHSHNRDAAAAVTTVTEGEMARRGVRREEPLAVELREFARAVRDGGPPPVDPHDAMVALLLARKMVESSLSGEAIDGDALEAVLS